jgi:hypothetical protein
MRPIVTQDTVARLPRTALLLLCVLYAVPGFFNHEPWRDEESLALARMLAATVPSFADLTTFIGNLSIGLFANVLNPAIAARAPFVALLLGSFALLWYSCYHFAREDAAQPAELPFGGEAHGVDYARAVADGALLAFMACLGLAEKGHQAAPALGQLFAICTLLYGLAAQRAEPRKSIFALLLSVLLLCGFGAPGMALTLSLALLSLQISQPARISASKAGNALVISALAIGSFVSALAWLILPREASLIATIKQFDFSSLLSLSVWFLWPLWFIVAFGVWRLSSSKRSQASELTSQAAPRKRWPWHFSAPVLVFVLMLIASSFSADQDGSLFPALPALAIASALMLALMPRSVLAAIDWFALALFTGAAAFVWMLWIAARTGVPAPINGNIERFYPGFREAAVWPFQALPFTLAVAATLGWLALVFWRTSRARKPLWKGMVLTAGGVTLTWLLLQTLGAPILNASRTFSPVVKTIDSAVPRGSCITSINISDAHQFLLSYGSSSTYGKVDERCDYALVRHTRTQSPHYFLSHEGWTLQWSVRRPSEREEIFSLFKRSSL